MDAIFVDEDRDENAPTFGAINKTEANRLNEPVKSEEEPSNEPTKEDISRLHTLKDDDKRKLVERLNSDGYDLLSQHFVREQRTWDDYKLVVNEKECQWEIHNRDGSVLKAYPLI